jgi:hypothetical protein
LFMVESSVGLMFSTFLMISSSSAQPMARKLRILFLFSFESSLFA